MGEARFRGITICMYNFNWENQSNDIRCLFVGWKTIRQYMLKKRRRLQDWIRMMRLRFILGGGCVLEKTLYVWI